MMLLWITGRTPNAFYVLEVQIYESDSVYLFEPCRRAPEGSGREWIHIT